MEILLVLWEVFSISVRSLLLDTGTKSDSISNLVEKVNIYLDISSVFASDIISVTLLQQCVVMILVII